MVEKRVSKMMMAIVVPKKLLGVFVARRTFAFMREVGCAQIGVNLKSDNGPAITNLVEKVGRLRAAASAQPMAVETSSAYACASNGVVERGVQVAKGHMRMSRSATEAALGVQIPVGAVARGVLGVLAQPGRGGPRRQDRIREV